MIKKLAEQLKRKNKKRGINITLGTVVGLLLSCTTVMGSDYINGDIAHSDPDLSYAIAIGSTEMRDVINHGNISASSIGTGVSYVIYITSAKMRDVINHGNIDALATALDPDLGFGISYGIHINSTEMNDIINHGSISAIGSKLSYGIFTNSTKMRDIINYGNMRSSSLGHGHGIYINSSEMRNIVNYGNINIIGSGLSTGISVESIEMGDIINFGDIKASGPIGNLSYGVILNNSKVERVINHGNINGLKGGIEAISTEIIDVVNHGNISSYSDGIGYGIDLSPKGLRDVVNYGNIRGTSVNSLGLGYGIYLTSALFPTEKRNIINHGNIVGSSLYNSYGVYIESTKMKDIINYGNMNALNVSSSGQGHGIFLASFVSPIEIRDLINIGIISGKNTSGRGYGIYEPLSTFSVDISNLGVIFGTTNAVYGKEAEINNYGILAAEGNSVVNGVTSINYGLYISGTDGKVSIDGTKQSVDPIEITIGHDESENEIKREMVIKNATIGADGKSTESFVISGGTDEYDNSILNGKDDTLNVSGSEEIKGSIINAYGTAIKFDTAGGELTLSGTIVNGGIDEARDTVVGSENGDTLILQSGEITYVDGSVGTQNTVINGNIDMKDGADTLIVGSGTIINGNINMGDGDDIVVIETGSTINKTLDGGLGNDTLNFEAALKTRTDSETGNEINILHNISNFENMNINTNVTLFEKTIGNDGEAKDLKVTGVDNITIGENGVLTLRIDSTKTDGTDKIVGHALYDNTGIIKSENEGKLLLALNGAGNESIISFGGIELDNSLITGHEGANGTFDTTSLLHSIKRVEGAANEIIITAKTDIPTGPTISDNITYEKLNKIYHSILSVDELGNFNVDEDEKLSTFLGYLNDIYAGNPYSYSSELSRKSMEMFRDIIVENIFRPETNKWMIHGGLTHIDGGTKDTYYGKGYYTYDIGSSAIESDTKITGAYMFGEYGISDTLTSGVVVGGNKLKSDLSNGSKVDGSAMYIGGYVKKYTGNLKLTAGAGFQYGDYDADRLGVNGVASDPAKSVMKYSDNYNDISYDIYLNGRYSNPIGDNLFLEPYGTLSYTYIKQDGADEGNKTLAIETDSKSFDYTSAKVGVDIKKVIPHEKGKSTVSAGVSYTKIINGAGEENITGKFKGGKDFDILVAHKNEQSIGLNAKYALELENGILFDVKGSYAVEKDSHNGSGKNKSKGEWIIGVGLGYKF